MRRVVLFIFGLLMVTMTFPQGSKKEITMDVFGKFQSMSSPSISNDGRYVLYTINNFPVADDRTLVIKTLSGSWEKDILLRGQYTGEFYFSGNSRQVIYKQNDSLYFLTLGSSEVKSISHINSYKLPLHGEGRWLAYQLEDSDQNMVLLDLYSGKESRQGGVEDYSFSDSGSALLMKVKTGKETKQGTALQWITLSEFKAMTIWKGEENSLGFYLFDKAGSQIAFEVTNGSAKEIWHYREGMNQAELLVKNGSPGIASGLLVSGHPQFNGDGNRIFFDLKLSAEERKTIPGASMVNVWSYKDKVTQPMQLFETSTGRDGNKFKAVISANGGEVIRVEHEDEEIQMHVEDVKDYMVVGSRFVEPWWKFSPQPSTWLVSLKDGSRKLIKKEYRKLYNFSISPGGRFLVYYDWGKGKYFSYEIETGRTIDIGKNVHSNLSEENRSSDGAENPYAVASAVGWLAEDKWVLIYDNYDIWKMDPSGNRPPVNVTNGYGKTHKTRLRLVYDQDATTYLDSKNQQLLTGFNETNKYNGFYKAKLSEKDDPELMTMGPYTYYKVNSQLGGPFYDYSENMVPLKALNADEWIVSRESSGEAPNYFITKDFKEYRAVSDVHPEKSYKWQTAELVRWKKFDGTIGQGILYKPEDFDLHKKYPVIINYYRQLSHQLFEFPYPGATPANINIPWFVARGYLVFTPDITFADGTSYKKGQITGEGAYNAVVSAAEYLIKLPYIDGKHMAIQGHSFGGGETNYLVTHSHLFAAAAEMAGASDPISGYLILVSFMGEQPESFDKVTQTEDSYGATPWQRPDLYIKSSAVLNANKVTTPILIVHNRKDNQINWINGLEWYMALRRLAKPSWLLEYDGAGHALSREPNSIDYTIRLTQFFDHYLKDAPPPKWMTEGVPARLKGIETGLELDLSGRQP